MSKIKFGIKIEFYKMQGTDYLIAKKIGDSNEFLTKVFNPPLMVLFFFTSLTFFFNSTLPYKKNIQLGSSLILKGFNCIKKIKD
jgi:hypothetical protein